MAGSSEYNEAAIVGSEVMLNPDTAGAPGELARLNEGKGRHLVDLNSVDVGFNPNIPSPSVLTNRKTEEHEILLAKTREHPYAHFGFGSDETSHSKWPTEYKWLLGFTVIVFAVALSAALATWILTGTGTFNVKMKWTTDFLIGGAYPATPYAVSYVKIGWFFAAGWTTIALAMGCLLFLPYAFFWYIKRQARWRKDEVKTITLCITLGLFAIGIAGGLGITNVFVILPWVISLMAIFFNTHYLPEKHYAGTMEILNALVPVVYHDGTTFRVEPDRKLTDNISHTSDGKEMNAGLGATEITFLAVAKMVTTWLITARDAIGAGIRTYLAPDQQRSLLFDLATHFTFIINPHLWIAIGTSPVIMISMILPIAYYGGALHNEIDTYSDYVHAAFWLFFASFYINLFWNIWYWSIWNVRRVVNPHLQQETTVLRVGGILHVILSWIYWVVFLLAISFTFLGGLHDHPTNHLYLG